MGSSQSSAHSRPSENSSLLNAEQNRKETSQVSGRLEPVLAQTCAPGMGQQRAPARCRPRHRPWGHISRPSQAPAWTHVAPGQGGTTPELGSRESRWRTPTSCTCRRGPLQETPGGRGRPPHPHPPCPPPRTWRSPTVVGPSYIPAASGFRGRKPKCFKGLMGASENWKPDLFASGMWTQDGHIF